jgi:methyl-accepting chemotaxis protein
VNLFSNLRIGKRLGLAFGTIILLLGLVSATGWLQIRHIGGNLNDVVTNVVPSLQILADLKETVQKIRRFEYRHVVAAESDMGKEEESARKASEFFEKTLKSYEPLIADDTDRQNYENLKKSWESYVKSRAALFAMSHASAKDKSKHEAVQAFLQKGDSTKTFDSVQEGLSALWAYNVKLAATAEADGGKAISSAVWILFGLSAVAILIGVLFAWTITRSITSPMSKAIEVAKRVADGDLNAKIEVSGKDEVANLMRELDKMVGSLQSVIANVQVASDQIATASNEIAQGNTDLSARTENQASSLQETAASMEQITGTVKQSADNARQAQQLAATASEVAAKGGAVVGEVVTTMDSITEASKKISDIIGVIDGIAFQTNILALNAAVEAARAGEQGRGFAVVAGEVRTLAQRSAQAAKEIKTLIGDSVSKVDAGSRLVADAGSTMDEIVSQVKRVTDLIGEITAATIEQSGGIEQVNQAVTQLDETTQQNAALVEQSAAAAASLKDQAFRLTESIAVFKLDQKTGVTSASPSASKAIATAVARASVAPKAAPKPVTAAVRKPSDKAAPIAHAAVSAPAPIAAKPAAKSGEDEWEEF